jgi:hypothetical protein
VPPLLDRLSAKSKSGGVKRDDYRVPTQDESGVVLSPNGARLGVPWENDVVGCRRSVRT